MIRNFLYFISFFILSGCSSGYNVKPAEAKDDGFTYRQVKVVESESLVASYREEAVLAVKQTFDDLDKMERYTEKSKTSDDRFKKVMRDFKREN